MADHRLNEAANTVEEVVDDEDDYLDDDELGPDDAEPPTGRRVRPLKAS